MACPSVLSVENGHSYTKFVFVSDREKGSDKSFAELFPSNHLTNCVHHIKQNVKSRFGAKAGEMVFPIAHAFYMIQEEMLLEELKMKSANAYEYLENIPMEHWCNMQWILTWKCPPWHQYDVVTSNTTECINSMIDDYDSEGWTNLLEGIL